MNLNHLFEKNANERSESVAIIHAGGSITWNTLYEAVKRLVRGLHKVGVSRGERIAIMLPNVPHFLISYYAGLRLGASIIPIDPQFKNREAAWILEDSEAGVLIIWENLLTDLTRYIERLESLRVIIVLGENSPAGTMNLTRMIAKNTPQSEIVDVDSEDVAVIQYTAGITGTPKGTMLTHKNITSNVEACREIFKCSSEDIILAAIPLNHPLGQTLVMHMAVASGATLRLLPKFDATEVHNALMDNSITVFPAIYSMFHQILEAGSEDDTPPEKPVRLCISGGGMVNEQVLRDFEQRYNTYTLECYGTTETSPIISCNQWRTGRRVGSLGHPIPGVEMRIVNERSDEVSIGEVGEIVVKGDNVMRGYLNRARSSGEVLRGGWFHTGDLGKMDINGFFYMVDRMHYRISKAGFSVYPGEIEEVLLRHPDVLDVGVVPIPDDIFGQDIKACVVLKEGSNISTEDIAAYCANHLALYKVPKIIRFYKDLPRMQTGRINRTELMQTN